MAKTAANDDLGHTTKAGKSECRFDKDTFLREHGFRIEWRETHKENMWSRMGTHYTQTQALGIADAESLQATEVKT